MTEELTRLAIYFQLVSYPLIVFGQLWLMTFRSDWKRRPTTIMQLLFVALIVVLFVADLYRLTVGVPSAVQFWDKAATPIVVLLAISVWWSVMWLSRQWRHNPFVWLS